VINLRDQLQSTLGGDFSISRELGRGGMSRVFMERAAVGDGDLLVHFANPMTNQVPRGARTDAVWRRFNLDPALFAEHQPGGRQ